MITLYHEYRGPYDQVDDPQNPGVFTYRMEHYRYDFDETTETVTSVQLTDEYGSGGYQGATPPPESYGLATTEEFHDTCQGTTYRGFYHDGHGGFTVQEVQDSPLCGYTGGGSGNPAPSPVPGCRDPKATNYNSAATVEDGTCTYAPDARVPVFAVPLLNSLRFVQPEATDTCTTFETLENTFFCQQTRPGQQMRPHYRQKVQRCDVLTLQVLTDFTGLTATVRRPGTTTAVATFTGERVRRYTGTADPLTVTLSAGAGGLTKLTTAAGTLPETLRRAARLTLSGAATGTYRVQQAGRELDGTAYLLLTRPWAAVTGAVQATWALMGVGFDVWEVTLDWADVDNGEYEVELRATDATEPAAVAVSEPLLLADAHPNTVLIEYWNRDNAFGLEFTTGLVGRLRVGGTFFKLKPSGTSQQHRSSSGVPTLLSSTAQRGILLETFELPDWLHEKLFVVLRLDGLRVNGREVLGQGDYEWTPVAGYPLSGGSATLEQLGWLGAGHGHDTGGPGPSLADNLLVTNGGSFLRLH